jgi:glucosylceramidase
MGTFFDNLQEAHDVDPTKLLVATESCDCPVMMDEAWSWNKAERQAADIMGDLSTWVVAWLDWNLLVDEHGGAFNLCRL